MILKTVYWLKGRLFCNLTNNNVELFIHVYKINLRRKIFNFMNWNQSLCIWNFHTKPTFNESWNLPWSSKWLKWLVNKFPLQFSSVQSLSRVWLFVTPWSGARQAFLPITNSWSLLKLMSIKPMMPSNYLTLSCPLHLLPSIFPSIRVFSNEPILHNRWPKYWSFSFIISPSNEYSGLISFRMDWLDLLAVQGTLKSLLQHHSSKASILQRSAFLWSNSHIHTWLLEKP